MLTYLGLTHLLENVQPHQVVDIYNIVKFLENKKLFIDMLGYLDISPRVSVFIGEEHIGGALKNSSIIVKKIFLNGYEGYLGIIGSTKMDYAFNVGALRQIL